MRPSKVFRRRAEALVGAALIAILAACSDSTGPSSVDNDAALRSLSLGMGAVSGFGLGVAAPSASSFNGLGAVVDQAAVTINGGTQTFFAIGLRETFPAGTCAETLFIIPSMPPVSGECTPPPMGTALVLWQSHSGNAPPDRMIVIAGDVGTSSFDFLGNVPAGSAFPSIAMYMEGENSLWISTAGSLTTQVTATGQTCALPLPPFAKSATCNIATFDEQANITLEPITALQQFGPSAQPSKQMSIALPHQSVSGVWQAITETQPVTLKP